MRNLGLAGKQESDHEAAEDVTQEVTLAMVEALPRHRSEDHSVGAFVFGIASNKVAMWHRATYRRPEVPSETTPEFVPTETSLNAPVTTTG